MSQNLVLVCHQPRGDHWQLGPLDGSLDGPLLIGWKVHPAPVDAGLPAAVASVLASSLVDVFRVTCLSSEFAAPAGDCWTPQGGAFVKRLLTRRGGAASGVIRTAPANASLVATRTAATVEALLDDAGFPWWLQGQVALLSDPALPTQPDIAAEDIAALTGPSWWQTASRVSGLAGVVRAGVDGAVAGAYFANEAKRESWLASLEAECRAVGFSFEKSDNATFAARL